MKLAPIPTCASRPAQGGWLARALRAGMAACMLAAVASSPALAQRHGDHDRADPRMQDPRMQDQRAQQDPRAMPQQPMPQRFEPRAFDTREFDDRRQDPAQRQEAARRPSRMTPDERRDLRRQINEAGADLYAHPPRH